MTLHDGRKITLPGVLHIPSLERNLIYVSKMIDAHVHTLFQKDSCKMVRCEMVLMKRVQIGTLYKLLGNVKSTGCNNIVAPKIDSTGCNNIVAPEIDSTLTQLESMSTQLDSTRANSVQIDLTRHDEIDLTRL
jgi:hypothetical protein